MNTYTVQVVKPNGSVLEYPVRADHYTHAIESIQRQIPSDYEVIGCIAATIPILYRQKAAPNIESNEQTPS